MLPAQRLGSNWQPRRLLWLAPRNPAEAAAAVGHHKLLSTGFVSIFLTTTAFAPTAADKLLIMFIGKIQRKFIFVMQRRSFKMRNLYFVRYNLWCLGRIGSRQVSSWKMASAAPPEASTMAPLAKALWFERKICCRSVNLNRKEFISYYQRNTGQGLN